MPPLPTTHHPQPTLGPRTHHRPHPRRQPPTPTTRTPLLQHLSRRPTRPPRPTTLTTLVTHMPKTALYANLSAPTPIGDHSLPPPLLDAPSPVSAAARATSAERGRFSFGSLTLEDRCRVLSLSIGVGGAE